MDELLARLRISELYARYNWAVDHTEPEAFALTFTEDGAFIGTIGTYEGRDQLEAFARIQDLKRRGLQHWNTNIVLSFVDENTVHGKAYMLALYQGERAPVVERAGFYSDVITREGGDWVFKTRRFAPLPGSPPLIAKS